REIELVNVVLDNVVEIDHHRHSIRGGYSLNHPRGRLVHLWAAVAGLVDVRVGGDVINVRPGGDLFINGFGEVDQEAIFLDVDLFDLEGHDAVPVDPLDGEGLRSAHGPLAVGGEAGGDQLAFG